MSIAVVNVSGCDVHLNGQSRRLQINSQPISPFDFPAPTSEPWLTLHYDEWICIVKGRVVFEVEGGSSTTAKAGQTVFISKGTRFRPSFPVGDTQCVPSPNFTTHNAFHYSIHFFKFRYVPVCVPAFRPDRCIREDTYGFTVLIL